MKEHSGGPPQTAFIPINHWGEESFEVHPIYMPDMSAGDRLSDVLREVEDRGEDPAAFCLTILGPQIFGLVCQAVRKTIALAGSPLAYDQMRWVCGASLMEGQTLGQLAKRHGISKQAFQQGCKRFRAVLDIRSQTARTPEARQKMRMRNSRRIKEHEGACESR